MKRDLALLAAACALWTLPASAQVQPQPRTISVTGHETQQIAPDQAHLTVSLVSRDVNLNKAKQDNDKLVEKLVTITKEYKIPTEKVANSNLYIAPEYDYTDGKQRFKGYTVSRTISITLDQLDIHERLLSSLVEAKIDQVNGIDFGLANPEKYASALRVKAFENAKSKASALATAAGAKLGQALIINTDGNQQSINPPRPMMMKAMAREASDMSVAPSLPGMVSLDENVSVTFAME